MVDVDSDGFISFNTRPEVEEQGGIVDVRSVSPNMFLGRATDYPRHSKHLDQMISAEVRELLLECLLQCVRVPTFMVDLWYNYDCDTTCGDLFEELVSFLSKNSYPDHQSYALSNSHILCMDTLLMFIGQMVDRARSEVRSELI
jgi:brefeldin A-resistance guanine nucleotide exchange factor 1